MEIDPSFGLPTDKGIFEEIAKGEQKITVTTAARRYGKITTIVGGFNKLVDIKATAKYLKEHLACGGTVKENTIELQGNHLRQIKPLLIKLGFDEHLITD